MFSRRLPLTYFLLFALLYVPTLFGFQVYGVGDTLGFNYPALKAITPFSLASLLADPFSGRGFPWLVTYGSLGLDAHLLRIVFSEFQTLSWLCVIYFTVGAWLFAHFLKCRGHKEVAVFIGGLVYACAFFWVGDGDYPLASSIAVFAALLVLLQRAHKHPLASTLLIALVIGYGWLAGHFNYIPLILVGSGVYALFAAYHSQKKRWLPPCVFGTGVVLGTLIGLLKLIPALAYIQLSERAGGLSAEAASTTTLHLSAIITTFFPYVRLPLLPGEIGGMFIGTMALALVLIGISADWQRLKYPIGIVLFCLLVAVPHSPLYFVIQHLPFFSYLRAPTRWLFLTYPAIALIVATTVDAVLAGKWKKERRRMGSIFLNIGIVALCLSIILALTNIFFAEAILLRAKQYFDTYLFAKTSGLPLEHYHRYIMETWQRLMEMLSLLSPRFAIPLLGILLSGIVLRRKTLQHNILVGLVIFSSMAPLFLHNKKAAAGEIQKIQLLYEDIGDAFVMPIMPGLADFMLRATEYGEKRGERFPYQLALLLPNRQALLNVHSIDFYQPLQPRRMARLLAAVGSGNAPVPQGENLALSQIPLEERLQLLSERSKLFSLLNVSYIVSAWDLSAPFTLKKDVYPVDRLPPIHIYNVPNPRPIVYGPARTQIVEPDEDHIIAALTALQDDNLSLIECTSCKERTGSLTAQVTHETPQRMEIVVDATAASWLIVSRPRIPGWRVSVDGELTKTAIANGMFFAVPIEKGEHNVILSITYPSLLVDSVRLLKEGDPWLL